MWRPKNSGGIGFAGGFSLRGPDGDSDGEGPEITREEVAITIAHTAATPAKQKGSLIILFFKVACESAWAADSSV
jgi:hypothetical protein